MARISDHTAFFGERLERVAWNEPCGLDIVAFEHLQKAADTDSSGEETCFASVGLLRLIRRLVWHTA